MNEHEQDPQVLVNALRAYVEAQEKNDPDGQLTALLTLSADVMEAMNQAIHLCESGKCPAAAEWWGHCQDTETALREFIDRVDERFTAAQHREAVELLASKQSLGWVKHARDCDRKNSLTGADRHAHL